MTYPIKQQIAADLDKVKAQSSTRVQRIKTIVKTAFSEAIAEVKDGGKEVKDTSKASLDNVLKTVLNPASAVESSATTNSATLEPILESISIDLAPGDAVVTVAPADDGQAAPSTVDSSVPEEATDGETAPLGDVAKRLLQAAGLQAQALLTEQYGKLKVQLPERYQQLQGKATAWDSELTARYGDRYGTLKARSGKVLSWYQDKLAQGRDLEPTPLERQQTQKAEEISNLGVTFAQKEDAVKQQINQTLRTITVHAQS